MSPLTRRRLLQGAGAAGIGLGVGGGIGYAVGSTEADESNGTGTVPFEGLHQAGIVTAQQDRLHFASFDMTTDRIADLRSLMEDWSDAAREMVAGELIGDVNEEPYAPPDDTGETDGLLPSRLTITFGFGPTLFDERFGLASQRPAELRELPPLPGDELDPSQSGETSACRPAPTIPRSPSTRSATSPGSGAGGSSCSGRSSASAAPRRRRRGRTPRAT